jgi:hypothetical protein
MRALLLASLAVSLAAFPAFPQVALAEPGTPPPTAAKHAQGARGVDPVGTPPTTTTTTYDFDDDLISGDLVGPDAEILRVHRGQVRQSLVRVRTDYIPELLQAVEQL